MTEPQKNYRESMVDRFQKGAQIDLDNWRDPQHDLEAIRLATPAERQAIEHFLLGRGIRHFMDAEALVLLDTPNARAALSEAFRTGSTEIQAAVAYLAPQWIDEETRIAELVRRVDLCDAYQDLSLTLTQIESTHPPVVIDAMLRRIARDPGVASVHFAGLLLYLHGQADEPFAREQRPFFLRFNPGDESDRRDAFAELCRRIGVEEKDYHAWWPKAPDPNDSA